MTVLVPCPCCVRILDTEMIPMLMFPRCSLCGGAREIESRLAKLFNEGVFQIEGFAFRGVN